MFPILLFCLAGIAVAQVPKPCTTPPQWEGRIFDNNEQREVSLRGRISYDSTYHRLRIVENIVQSGEDIALDILILYDSNIEFIYDLKFQNCTRITVNEPWRDAGIQPDAAFQGEAYLGSSALPGAGLLVTMWAGNLTYPTNETIPYFGTWTYEGCLPLSLLTFSEKYGNEIASYYDITVGISDPNVFIPRRECLTDKEYALREVLYGTPSKKNK